VTETLSSAVVSAPVESVTDTLSDPGVFEGVAPALDPGSGLAEALTSSVEGVGGTVGEGAAAVVGPLTTSVEAGAPDVVEGVGGSIGPFTTSVGDPVDGLVGAVPGGAAVDAFSVAVAPPASAAAGATAGDESAPVEAPPDPAPQQSLADGAASTAVPAAAAGAPVSEPGSVFAGMPADDPLTVPGGLGGGESGSAAVAGPQSAEVGMDLTAVPPADAAAVVPSAAGDGGVLNVLAEVGQDTRIVATAAVLTLAGAAIIGPRAGGSGTDARLAFTNVRLLPCLVKEGTARQLTALTEALVPVAAPAAASISGGAGITGTPGAAAGVAAEYERSRLGSMIADLSEGFGRATRDAAGEAADGLSDSRLMVQFGMLLGVLYLAFLSVWFWLTRARERPPV
jgi:hypothetical protein